MRKAILIALLAVVVVFVIGVDVYSGTCQKQGQAPVQGVTIAVRKGVRESGKGFVQSEVDLSTTVTATLHATAPGTNEYTQPFTFPGGSQQTEINLDIPVGTRISVWFDNFLYGWSYEPGQQTITVREATSTSGNGMTFNFYKMSEHGTQCQPGQ